ncbi:hypothetical protein [Phyllobacterium brassicacearum]|uniref:hypothetical protein n=1 Tax=Phyllobacterium brassicacearum TaxID=314235 RepID=UPI00105C8478|nr:hypothetical protein [Phyllobacterium brassicacearum]
MTITTQPLSCSCDVDHEEGTAHDNIAVCGHRLYLAISSAAEVRIEQVKANDVATVVHAEKTLGDGIDGLLGRSFLSRFDVTVGAKEWRIESKKH